MAELYATHPPAILLYAMGITQHTTGVDNVKSCCNLALLCGNVGVRGGGVNPLRGQNNVQGACDMGGLPNVFPGYQPVADQQTREKFAKAWGRPLPERPGLTITDMIPAMQEGKLKGLYVIGENPKLSDPDWNHFSHALKKLDFVVVQELFLSETAQAADVVLAAASWPKKTGPSPTPNAAACASTKPSTPSPTPCRIGKFWHAFPRLWGMSASYHHPEEIFDEMTALNAKSYGGMTYERLGIDGLQWPCPDQAIIPAPLTCTKEQLPAGQGQISRRRLSGSGRNARCAIPLFPDHRTHVRPLSHRDHDPDLPAPRCRADHRICQYEPSGCRKLTVKEGDILMLSSRREKWKRRPKSPIRCHQARSFCPSILAKTRPTF